ncbi:hypothetical protein [Legionella yabuuchiae]|uniref:hypothetical protein n=1 Tax=Legionella yabuuchiae TaxID=376727 RepID=UPI001F5E8B9D|nr:hypothetical protein [Legionella yabuuchiae]
MNALRLLLTLLMTLLLTNVYALGFGCNTCTGNQPCVNPCPPPEKPAYKPCPECCEGMGGVHYCDSSAGRFVCRNGDYSTCYCDRHAVMDLHKIMGCCLWQGGVLKKDETGLVICNNGAVSEICTRQNILDAAQVSW